jgi:hypothetical protein
LAIVPNPEDGEGIERVRRCGRRNRLLDAIPRLPHAL